MRCFVRPFATFEYPHVSLSVQKRNRAVKLYERLGFQTVRETPEEYIMLRTL